MSGATERWIASLPVNPQFREELLRFAADGWTRWRALALASVVGPVLVMTWPGSSVLERFRDAMTHEIVGQVAIVLVLLLSVWTGVRAPAGHGQFSVKQWAVFVPLPAGRYLRGTLTGRLLDPLFLTLLIAPLLMASAMARGAPLWQWVALLAILLGSALAGALAALNLQLWLDKQPLALIAAGGAFLAAVLGLGWRIWPPLSPLSAFAGIGIAGDAGAWEWIASPWPGFLPTHAALDGALFALAWSRVRALRARSSEASGPSPA